MKMTNSLSRKLGFFDIIPGWLKRCFTVYEERCWTELPDDVMELILQQLLMSDYLRCRDVCRSWRASIDSKRCLPAYHKLPWLLLDSCNTFYFKDGCFVRDGKVYKWEKDCTIYSPGCVGSIEGWLIMATLPRSVEKSKQDRKVYDFFFSNPVTGARILLPSDPPFEPYFIKKAVASSVPSETRLEQRQRQQCFVSCLGQGRLAFCAPGDESWTSIEAKAEWSDIAVGFHDIMIVHGKLYALGIKALEFLMVLDIQLSTNGCGIHTCTAQRLVTVHSNVDKFEGRVCRPYLAKGSESKELFMIVREYENFRTRGFQVLKLEHNVNTASTPRWVEVVDLGDQVLFLGALTNKFISLGSSTSHDQTLERNSIYFVFNSSGAFESGIFSLTNKSIKPLNICNHQKYGLYGAIDRTLWFTPTSL